jgi:hypothetical protein
MPTNGALFLPRHKMRTKFWMVQQSRFKRRVTACETEGGQDHERHRRQQWQGNARRAQGKSQQASPQIKMPPYQYW